MIVGKVLKNHETKQSANAFRRFKIYNQLFENKDKKLNIRDLRIKLCELENEIDYKKSPECAIIALKDAMMDNKEIWYSMFISENILSKLTKQQYFEKLNMTFQNAFNLSEHHSKQNSIIKTFDDVCMNLDLKTYINEQLEKTKALKKDLDNAKDDLYNNYTQDEDEGE